MGYKVVLVGESDVGKSSLFVRFRDGKFMKTLTSTIGLDHTSREVKYKKRDGTTGLVDIQLWDTAGLERTGFMTNNYYVQSRAVIMMYDVSDMSSLNRLRSWFDDANQYCPKDDSNSSVTKFFLLGNKIDLSSGDIEVTEQQGKNFAENVISIPKENVFQVSVKTGKGLDSFLNDIAMVLSETKEPLKQQNLILDDEDVQKESKCC